MVFVLGHIDPEIESGSSDQAKKLKHKASEQEGKRVSLPFFSATTQRKTVVDIMKYRKGEGRVTISMIDALGMMMVYRLRYSDGLSITSRGNVFCQEKSKNFTSCFYK